MPPPPTLIPSTLLLRSLRLSLSPKTSLSPPLSSTTTTTNTTHPSLPLPHHHHHHPHLPHRTLHTSPPAQSPPPSAPSTHRDRGPPSQETTQTDFSALDIYTHTAPPAGQIDACLSDGFHLSNGVKIGNHQGLLLVGGEAFAWTPWRRASGSDSSSPTQKKMMNSMVNAKGEWIGGGADDDDDGWGLLRLVWPKPELLILGVGGRMMPLAAEVRRLVNGLGVAVDVQDTGNAAAQFNLLATERGVSGVAAALVPVGWRG